jgi:hypothetical protein
MRARLNKIVPLFLILSTTACIDRIDLDIGNPSTEVTIVGYISDQPGPYEVRVTNVFDIDSKQSTKVGLRVKLIELSDNVGNKEELSYQGDGIYLTSANGMQGIPGGVYKLKIEFFDGRVYESIPDTILSTGIVDSVYHTYREEMNPAGVPSYGYDIYFNASKGLSPSSRFLWKATSTYQVDTNPELNRRKCDSPPPPCSSPNQNCGCPAPLPCSGYVLRPGTNTELDYIKPCECCSCWVNIYNSVPILSDGQYVQNGQYFSVMANYVPITKYTFMYKVRNEISQFSLTNNSYNFWKAIRDQKEANGSLFEPVSGKIPINFIQLKGFESTARGLFYATSISSNNVYIDKSEIPNPFSISVDVSEPFPGKKELGSCLDFQYSTNIKPDFWID